MGPLDWNEFIQATQWFFAAGLGMSVAILIIGGFYSAAMKLFRKR